MSAPEPVQETQRWAFLPAPGTIGYHVLLASVAIFVLGPLGGVTAAYMNFSLGFFVGGQVLAGILGSAVTYGYGAEGKHGANYMQTMAASVAGMSGMAVLVQAAVWLGVPQPPWWVLSVYFGSIGMFGVGVGMLYTPFLVDRMQLTFPSGLAVANILRALTDVKLLRSSITKLGSGAGLGFLGGIASTYLVSLGGIGLSTSTVGAGMIVGARIAIPGLVVGIIGEEVTPWLRDIGWLQEGEPFRKIGFVIALGTILGAAIVDITMILVKFAMEIGKPKQEVAGVEPWQQTNTAMLVGWVLFWGVVVVGIATQLLALPLLYVCVALGLVFLFLVVNGISQGISDSNPISSAFVLTVFTLGFLGLTDPGVGLLCAAILLISTSVGVDMQQDRSTGWRLGTPRNIQFRYQVVGILMGAVLSVGFAKVFMAAYPALVVNQFDHAHEQAVEEENHAAAEAGREDAAWAQAAEAGRHADAASEQVKAAKTHLEGALADPTVADRELGAARAALGIATAEIDQASEFAGNAKKPDALPFDGPDEAEEAELARWQSAMTYKFVGALSGLESQRPHVMTALFIGIVAGLVIEILRKMIKNIPGYREWAKDSRAGFAVDFTIDAIVLPSPYASSFGGFVDFFTTLWFAVGGCLTSFAGTIEEEATRSHREKAAEAGGAEIPDDMSTTSLVGGGLIAGDSLAALTLGIIGLLSALLAR